MFEFIRNYFKSPLVYKESFPPVVTQGALVYFKTPIGKSKHGVVTKVLDKDVEVTWDDGVVQNFDERCYEIVKDWVLASKGPKPSRICPDCHMEMKPGLHLTGCPNNDKGIEPSEKRNE